MVIKMVSSKEIKKDKKVLRSNELTAVLGRDEMDKLSHIKDKDSWNKYRELYDLAPSLDIVTDYPIQLDIELNSSCNLNCPMCPISAESNKGKGKSTWFSFDRYKEIVIDGVNNGLKAVKLNYINEPLIRDDLYKFIEFADEAGVLDIYLSTNGLLMDEDVSKKLIKSGLTRIQISIDSVTEKVYDQMRPGGDFSKTISNINTLLDIRKKTNSITPLVRVNFVRTDINEHEVEDFISFWKDKVDMVGVQEFVNPPSSSKRVSSSTSINKKKEGFRCSFPFKQLVINNEGNILPCCTFWGESMALGKLSTISSIKKLWNSQEMKSLRKIHKEGRYYDNPICNKCVEAS